MRTRVAVVSDRARERIAAWASRRGKLSYFGPFFELADAVVIVNPWHRAADIDIALANLNERGISGLVYGAVDAVDDVLLLTAQPIAGSVRP